MASLQFRHVDDGSLTFVFQSAHLTGFVPPFPATLTTSALGPKQLAVVWALTLSPEPEGPALISHAASTSVRSSTSLSRLRGAQPPLYDLCSAEVTCYESVRPLDREERHVVP